MVTKFKSFVIPVDELKVEDLITLRKTSLDALRTAIASEERPVEQFIVRDILPKTDLGLSNEEWKITYSNAYTWETKIDIALPSDKFLVIYGISIPSPTPKTLAIKFWRDVSPICVVDLEKVYAYKQPIVYLPQPIVWKQKQIVKVEFYGKATGDDYVVLLGFVAEKIGVTIKPNA